MNITVQMQIPYETRFAARAAGDLVSRTNVSLICPYVQSSQGASGASPWDKKTIMQAGAFNSELFEAYRGLYDEVKLNSMSVSVAVTNQVGGNSNPDVTIVSGFDRKFTKVDYVDHIPNVGQLSANGSCVRRTFVNNQVAKAYRSCWASDLGEKCTFTDTDAVTDTFAINYAGGLTGTNAHTVLASWSSAGANVNYFCPCFMFGFESSANMAADSLVTTMLDIRYNFTFRNPKYGGSIGPGGGLRSVAPSERGVEKAGKSEIVGKKDVDQDELTDLLLKLKKLHLIDDDDDGDDELTQEMPDDKS